MYVKKDDAPTAEAELLGWMAARLREAYGGLIDPSQIEVGTHCVTITFKDSGTKVDVVPVLYEGDANDCGYLIAKDTGDRERCYLHIHCELSGASSRRSGAKGCYGTATLMPGAVLVSYSCDVRSPILLLLRQTHRVDGVHVERWSRGRVD